VDRIPEAAAARLEVVTRARARHLSWDSSGVACDAEIDGSSRTLRARGVVLALPGHLLLPLCRRLPQWIAEPLSRTRYAPVVSAHVALRRPPHARLAGYGFTGPSDGLGNFELEHHRAPGRCPPGTGMVSVYFIETPSFRPMELEDDGLRCRAVAAVEKTFPECRSETSFVHLVRWEAATPLFPPRRMTEMAGLRRRLAGWDAPADLCGDYLDGLSSEGALRTGEQAAQRLAARLNARRP
jgi:protoporphyrinogen/coproporphyrinogen III oxidase